jgi:hypothetical protein
MVPIRENDFKSDFGSNTGCVNRSSRLEIGQVEASSSGRLLINYEVSARWRLVGPAIQAYDSMGLIVKENFDACPSFQDRPYSRGTGGHDGLARLGN